MKPFNLLSCLLIAVVLSACSESPEPNTQSRAAPASTTAEPRQINEAGALTLKQIWKTDGLITPESVIYDAENEVLYVSNINGSPTEVDQNGFISKVSLQGEMMTQQWVAGLNAPKGLALHLGKLYVADLDTLVEIDTSSAAITQRFTAEGAKMLNDVTVTPKGEIMVSDMLTNSIHRLYNGDWALWLQDKQLAFPNGLHAEQDRLIVGAWGVMTDGFATEVPGSLLSISYTDKKISNLGNGAPVGNLDGIEPLTTTSYLVTDWMAGKLYRIEADGSAKLLLELQQGMADLEWIESQSLLLLPMMNNNSLLAYTLK